MSNLENQSDKTIEILDYGFNYGNSILFEAKQILARKQTQPTQGVSQKKQDEDKFSSEPVTTSLKLLQLNSNTGTNLPLLNYQEISSPQLIETHIEKEKDEPVKSEVRTFHNNLEDDGSESETSETESKVSSVNEDDYTNFDDFGDEPVFDLKPGKIKPQFELSFFSRVWMTLCGLITPQTFIYLKSLTKESDKKLENDKNGTKGNENQNKNETENPENHGVERYLHDPTYSHMRGTLFSKKCIKSLSTTLRPLFHLEMDLTDHFFGLIQTFRIPQDISGLGSIEIQVLCLVFLTLFCDVFPSLKQSLGGEGFPKIIEKIKEFELDKIQFKCFLDLFEKS